MLISNANAKQLWGKLNLPSILIPKVTPAREEMDYRFDIILYMHRNFRCLNCRSFQGEEVLPGQKSQTKI